MLSSVKKIIPYPLDRFQCALNLSLSAKRRRLPNCRLTLRYLDLRRIIDELPDGLSQFSIVIG